MYEIVEYSFREGIIILPLKERKPSEIRSYLTKGNIPRMVFRGFWVEQVY